MKRLILFLALATLPLAASAQTLTVTLIGYPSQPAYPVGCSATVTKLCLVGFRVFDITTTRTAVFTAALNSALTGGVGSGHVLTYAGSIVAAIVAHDAGGIEILSADSTPVAFSPPHPTVIPVDTLTTTVGP